MAERILTTHVGSLVRPLALVEFLRARDEGRAYDEAAFSECLRESVAEVVRRQAQAGIDIVSDGEFGKTLSWARYIRERLAGFEQRGLAPEMAGRTVLPGTDKRASPSSMRTTSAARGSPGR